jgi:hypothetical protein
MDRVGLAEQCAFPTDVDVQPVVGRFYVGSKLLRVTAWCIVGRMLRQGV